MFKLFLGHVSRERVESHPSHSATDADTVAEESTGIWAGQKRCIFLSKLWSQKEHFDLGLGYFARKTLALQSINS